MEVPSTMLWKTIWKFFKVTVAVAFNISKQNYNGEILYHAHLQLSAYIP